MTDSFVTFPSLHTYTHTLEDLKTLPCSCNNNLMKFLLSLFVQHSVELFLLLLFVGIVEEDISLLCSCTLCIIVSFVFSMLLSLALAVLCSGVVVQLVLVYF